MIRLDLSSSILGFIRTASNVWVSHHVHHGWKLISKVWTKIEHWCQSRSESFNVVNWSGTFLRVPIFCSPFILHHIHYWHILVWFPLDWIHIIFRPTRIVWRPSYEFVIVHKFDWFLIYFIQNLRVDCFLFFLIIFETIIGIFIPLFQLSKILPTLLSIE